MSLEQLLNHVKQRECQAPSIEASRWTLNPIKREVDDAATLYRNCNSDLEIDFALIGFPLRACR
jgi:hypothetical protein